MIHTRHNFSVTIITLKQLFQSLCKDIFTESLSSDSYQECNYKHESLSLWVYLSIVMTFNVHHNPFQDKWKLQKHKEVLLMYFRLLDKMWKCIEHVFSTDHKV